MKYVICQQVRMVDMNNEIMQEVEFVHGEWELPSLSVGSSVVTALLGLKQFEVVYDRRKQETVRSKIVDIEYNLSGELAVAKVFLEPVQLIIGQHDVGEV
ncbi:hypothetical protein [Paenibacillus sp. y28]|uniref:hypothetical protein n=1 Tax=Paenibacillus sp. y28 TaxID=3129110 RepID=UPI003019432E